LRLSRHLCGLAVVLATYSPLALADFTCTGVPSGVAVDLANGDLLVESIGSVSWPRLCSLRTAANAITPEDCKRIHATLLLAQVSSGQVTLYVHDSNTSNTCSSITQWNYVNGLYFIKVHT